MLWRKVAAGALAAVVCWGWTAAANAGDVFRLGLNSEAPTFNLKGDGGARDVLPVWGHGGYGAGYYNGYYSGYYGAYYPRYYGSYYYPRYYGSYYYPSYYYGYSYYPRYYGSYYYYPSYYSYYPGYSYYYPSYYGISFVSPIGCPAGGQDVAGLVLTPDGKGTKSDSYKPAVPAGPRKPVPQDGTYPYDGGPPDPVPMPRVEPAPAGKVRPQTVPLEGRAVSLPPAAAPKKKYEYLAYGEKPAAADAAPETPKRLFAQDRIVVLTADPARKAPR
jgi:hypothetical protein